MSPIKCYLRCLENSHEPILLEDGVDVTFGRGPDTKIKDSRCSRSQIKLKANYSKKTVAITQLGRNACGLNGLALKKDFLVTASHGDRVEILLGQYIHMIEFQSTPEEGYGIRTRGKEKNKNVESLKSADEQSEKQNTADNENGKQNATNDESGKQNAAVDESCKPITTDNDSFNSLEPPTKRSRTEESPYWESVDNGKLLVYTPEGVKPSNLIAGYDLDGTIITTVSGAVFPKYKNDWKILYKETIGKLKDLHENSYKIIFFTNQASLGNGTKSVTDFKTKIEEIVKLINLPIQVFIATGYSVYRKPATGMWNAAVERNNNMQIDMVKSFYCGDAAGREAGDYLTKKDFSQCDLLFAKNLDITFVTPEHHFLNKKLLPMKISVFDPKTIPCDIPLCEPSWGQVLSNRLEVIVLVGAPASGKTHFAKTHLLPAGYVHVNRDTLNTWSRCAQAMHQALQAKQRVVVDNTNPDVEARRKVIEIAKQYTPIVRCFVMNTDFQHIKHNNKFRQLTEPQSVGDAVINTFMSKYQEPKVSEGFSEILKINFWLTFKNPELEKLYKLFLLDK